MNYSWQETWTWRLRRPISMEARFPVTFDTIYLFVILWLVRNFNTRISGFFTIFMLYVGQCYFSINLKRKLIICVGAKVYRSVIYMNWLRLVQDQTAFYTISLETFLLNKCAHNPPKKLVGTWAIFHQKTYSRYLQIACVLQILWKKLYSC